MCIQESLLVFTESEKYPVRLVQHTGASSTHLGPCLQNIIKPHDAVLLKLNSWCIMKTAKGLWLQDDNDFIKFNTAYKTHTKRKEKNLTIENTPE